MNVIYLCKHWSWYWLAVLATAATSYSKRKVGAAQYENRGVLKTYYLKGPVWSVAVSGRVCCIKETLKTEPCGLQEKWLP